MKIIHQNGYTKDELLQHRLIVSVHRPLPRRPPALSFLPFSFPRASLTLSAEHGLNLPRPRPNSYKNLVDSAQAVVMACRKLGVDPEEPTNRVRRSSCQA